MPEFEMNGINKVPEEINSDLSKYNLPKNIEIREAEHEVWLTTDSGEFRMPIEMFKLYIEKFSFNKNDNLYRLGFYITEIKDDPDSIRVELRRQIREILSENGLKPEDFADRGGSVTERINEIISLLPKNLLDAVVFREIDKFFTAVSYPEADCITYFEHCVIGSTASQFFGRPFMGGFQADKNWKEKVKIDRENYFNTHKDVALNQQGLLLFTNQKDPVNISSRVWENYNYINAASQELGQAVRQKMKQIYGSISSAPADFEDVDSARIVLTPTAYDDNMEAIPQPVRLDFLKGKKVIAFIDDPLIVGSFKPKSEDCRLADMLEDSDGTRRSVEMETNGFVHVMKFSDTELLDWYNTYLQRIVEN